MKNQKKDFMIAILLTAFFTLQVAPTFAQQEVLRPRANEEEFAQMVDAFYISRLQESLQLSDEQFASLLPAVKNFLKVRRQTGREKQMALRELNAMLESNAEENQLKAQLLKMDQIDQQNEASARKALTEIEAKLSVKQRAQFKLYQMRVDGQIARMIQRVREGAPAGPRGPRAPIRRDRQP